MSLTQSTLLCITTAVICQAEYLFEAGSHPPVGVRRAGQLAAVEQVVEKESECQFFTPKQLNLYLSQWLSRYVS